MKHLNLNRQLRFVRYGLPAIQIFLLLALMVVGQLLLVEFNTGNDKEFNANHPALFNLNRQLFACLKQLKQAGTEQQNHNTSNNSDNESDGLTETGNQRFYDSKGVRWIFNSDEKKWHKQP